MHEQYEEDGYGNYGKKFIFKQTLIKLKLEDALKERAPSGFDQILSNMIAGLPRGIDTQPGSVIRTLLEVVALEIDKK